MIIQSRNIILCGLYLSTILSISSCGKKDATQVETSEMKAGFVANPQVIEELPIAKLAIGDKAPPFHLPDINGKFHKLEDYSDKNVLVVNFTCNHCPTAQAYEDRFIAVVNEYAGKSVAFVAISPNSPIAILPEELGYTDLNDTFEEMKIRAVDKGYNFPYLYDGDTHEFSTAYGPTATPHIFIFNQERKLTYSGRIDSKEKPGSGNAEDLRNAIEATLNGDSLPLDEAQTPAFGCSIKWAWKNEYTVKMNEEWAKKPVTLEKLKPLELQKLLQNDTKQLLLVNFWATWCGPCIIEYPEFVNIQRMYGTRDFRFVSISMDNPELMDKALKFLQSKASAVPNYLMDTEDKYEVIKLLGQEWDGSLPITLLIEPGGKISYKVLGTIEPLVLKRAIVDHPMIGRYF
jgi:thiol-disulfide isomerase/thioredoxin